MTLQDGLPSDSGSSGTLSSSWERAALSQSSPSIKHECLTSSRDTQQHGSVSVAVTQDTVARGSRQSAHTPDQTFDLDSPSWALEIENNQRAPYRQTAEPIPIENHTPAYDLASIESARRLDSSDDSHLTLAAGDAYYAIAPPSKQPSSSSGSQISDGQLHGIWDENRSEMSSRTGYSQSPTSTMHACGCCHHSQGSLVEGCLSQIPFRTFEEQSISPVSNSFVETICTMGDGSARHESSLPMLPEALDDGPQWLSGGYQSDDYVSLVNIKMSKSPEMPNIFPSGGWAATPSALTSFADSPRSMHSPCNIDSDIPDCEYIADERDLSQIPAPSSPVSCILNLSHHDKAEQRYHGEDGNDEDEDEDERVCWLLSSRVTADDEQVGNTEEPFRRRPGSNFRRTPTPGPTRTFSHPSHAASSRGTRRQRRENAKDMFLVRSKLAGMSYKDIRAQGRFTEAESTLRGRFRTLTKVKEKRLRKPKWTDHDIHLLTEAVQSYRGDMHARTTNSRDVPVTDEGGGGGGGGGRRGSSRRVKTPWKKIAAYIADNGGTYHFGNATCKKKWDEVKQDHFGQQQQQQQSQQLHRGAIGIMDR
ncbi:MAG: hypothetical protein M1825_006079 [Sarcosagium campestre]|nr:MAG: hypothetical protein M1825_006079 [Sarcosagium campestre]